MKRQQRTPMIYFAQVRGGGPIKIGCSHGPKRRVLGLQAWCPLPLDFLCMAEGDRYDEAVILGAFKDYRMHGEWFEPNENLTALIAEIVSTGKLPSHIVAETLRRARARKKDAAKRVAKKRPWKDRKDHRKRTPEVTMRHTEKAAAASARRLAARGAARKFNFALTMNDA